jgi:arsenate reductase
MLVWRASQGTIRAMSDDFPITIYHNPDCGTSRNALTMIKTAGYEPIVIEYLKTGWTKSQLKSLLSAMGLKPQEVLRKKVRPPPHLAC